MQRRAVMRHTVNQSTNISLMSTYKLWQSRRIMTKTTCSKMIKIIYKPDNQTSSQMIYNSESMHVKWAEQSWQNQSHYAKTDKMINQYNQHVDVPNEYNNQACIQWYQELSMCNQQSSKPKLKKRWVSIDRPIKCHICFILSSSLTSKWSLVESPFCGPRILLDVFPLNGETRFFIYLVKIWFL